MGLAASQARLLTITSRLHDIELKQQNISNQKMRLANESDEVSTAYSKALNTQRFTLNNGTSNVKMNIKNLLNSGSGYALRTKDGKRVTSSDKDKFFAAVCEDMNRIMKECNSAYGKGKDAQKYANDPKYKEGYDWWQSVIKSNSLAENQAASFAIMMQTDGKYNGYEDWGRAYGINTGLTPSLDEIIAAAKEKGVTISREEHLKYLEEFKQIVGENSTGNIKDGTFTITMQTVSFDEKQMNDPNWLYNMIEAGELVLINANGKEVSTSSAKDIDTEYDKEVATRAEAEYNAATSKINRKEKILDNEARKLDTEYSAMNTEYESLKNIIKNNSDKTFNLFS